MSGMDRLSDADVEWHAAHGAPLSAAMARELLAHRRASQAAPAPSEPVTLTYTNWQGKTAQRTITPVRVWFGSTPWHPEPQWLLTAVDAEKGLERDFALKDFGAPAPSDAANTALNEAREKIAARRNACPPGPLFRAFNEAMGDIEDVRFALPPASAPSDGLREAATALLDMSDADFDAARIAAKISHKGAVAFLNAVIRAALSASPAQEGGE